MSEITKSNVEVEIRDISPLICELRGQAVTGVYPYFERESAFHPDK